MEASHHHHHHHHLSPLCPQHHHHLHHHHHHHPFHPQCVVHPHHVQHHHHPHPHHHHHHPSCILKPHCVPTQNPLSLPQDITNLEVLEDSELLQEYVQIEEEEYDDEEPVFVMTDEWMEFFAKSEAKRQLEKKQAKILKKKEKKMNKGTE